MKSFLDKITEGGKNVDPHEVNKLLTTEEFHKIVDQHGSIAEALTAAYPKGSTESGGGAAKPGEHVPPGSKKKGAFGGLFKTHGTTPEQNYTLTLNDYLAKPAKSGSHYRNMLAHLIKEAPGMGYGDKVSALKDKLGQAFANAGEALYTQGFAASAANDPVKAKELFDKGAKAHAKAKEYGYKTPEQQGVSPTVTAAVAAQAMKENPKLAEIVGKPQPAPQATAEELKKAKKNTTFPISSTDPDAVAAIKVFNEKYAGKELTDPAALNQKVADYKAMNAVVEQGKKKQEAEQLQKQAEAQKAAAAAAKKEAEAYAKKFDTPEAKEHFETLSAILGGAKGAQGYLESAAKKLAAIGLTGKMTPTEAAMIIAYSGSHYREVNSQLRAGIITEEQYKFTKALNQALDKLPVHTKTTYRKASLTSAQAAQYKPGYIVPERAFTSSSKQKGVWSGSHHYVIEGKGGRDISMLSSSPGEAEVLFKANSHFMVVKVEGNQIHLREMG